MDILKLLEPIIELGVRVEVYRIGEKLRVDLNTHAKSHCYLEKDEDGWKAFRRYDRVDSFETTEDIISLVYDCEHYRDFFCADWCNVFDIYGYTKFDWRK